MSKISDANKVSYKKSKVDAARHTSEVETNFMSGESYKMIDPLTTLKLVTASSIYGEPQYYVDGMKSKKTMPTRFVVNRLVGDNSILSSDAYSGKDTVYIMEDVIDKALDYDFAKTLEWAVTLRNDFYMRLNPQIIMTRAAIHPKRKEFTEQYPGGFDYINQQVMLRADDPMSQLSYYVYKMGNKNNMPSLLKRSIAKKISSLGRYQVAKYKNKDIGLANAAKIVHANSTVLDELIQTGTVKVYEDEQTWENLRSAGTDWKTIFETISMPHMALLRNLRGVFTEIEDIEFCKTYLAKLKSGIAKGKQFPFRYYTAMKAVSKDANVHHKSLIVDALDECIDLAMENMPHIKGKTIALSDNSGSAWGTFNSEYGSVTVADIDNLSAACIAKCSDEGYVGYFGDKLFIEPITKRSGVLTQIKSHNISCQRVGGATENGIWIFFRDAIDKKIWYDNIVIFSDQQAGHGGLYGTGEGIAEYRKRGFDLGMYVNVMDLILEYRKQVNPKVNVMSVQTAGYTNAVIPENIYRGTISYGWTGKEAVALKSVTDIWDEYENNKNSNNNSNV